jgi:hypothetical protein
MNGLVLSLPSIGWGAIFLPPACDDQVLLPVRDEEETVRVDLADVTGLEPAVGGHRFRRCLGTVEVPLHDVGTARQDLAVGRDQDFNILQWPSHRAEPERVERVDRDDG